MRFAINLPAFNAMSDVHALAELAHEAEENGWDGFFLWDHMQTDPNGPTADPGVALTAIAMRTERIRFGALVIPPDLQKAIAKTPGAAAKFNALTPWRQKQFLYRLNDAKKEETRLKRIAEVLRQLS